MKSGFLIAGTKSGAGKTVITLGIMAALIKRGLLVQPFKCGPDFIDPSLHKLVTGKESSNLDFRMCGGHFCKHIFYEKTKECDVAVVEGVMGLFDGEQGSGAYLAEQLAMPVILIIDVRSAAQSVAAVLHGFESYRPGVNVAGVIFNFVGSDRHRKLIKDEVEEHCKTPVLGFLPRKDVLTVPGRHLGLHMGEELEEVIDLQQIITLIEDHIELDKLLSNTRYLPPSVNGKLNEQNTTCKRVTLAVARDEAFCFYYSDNFKIFEDNGIDIVFFSPLNDHEVPRGVDGVYFGGGYPELYAEKLAANKTLKYQIKRFSDIGGLIYGECGGFMYLTHGITDIEGKFHEMSGIFPMQVKMNSRMRKLGYRQVTLKKDCFLGVKGTLLYGHEFHYSEIDQRFEHVESIYENLENSDGYQINNTIGSYVHLHFGRDHKPVEALYRNLLEIQRKDV